MRRGRGREGIMSRRPTVGARELIIAGAILFIIGAIFGHAASYGEISKLRSEVDKLTSERSQLRSQVSELQSKVGEYEELQRQFKELDNAYKGLKASYDLLLSNCTELKREYGELLENYTKLCEAYQILKGAGLTFGGLKITGLEARGRNVVGNVTNVSDRPMKAVYIFLFVYGPDGSLERYLYRVIENLAVGETNSFEFRWAIGEGQAFKVVAVGSYGLTDIEAGEVARLLARVKELESMLKWHISILTDREYYYSVIEDIRRANGSILVAMYSMVYDPGDALDWANDLIRELVNAKRRGVNVTVILEHRAYHGYMDENLEAYNYLSANNVTVLLDEDSATDHVKLVVIDGKVAYVGSHNWSESALYYNREASVRIVGDELAKELERYIGTIISRAS